jgi:type IV pilus assembly protein PilA
MRKVKGFTLIELLIVIAIILIVAALAVPNLLRARMAANDSDAASTIRTINTSEVTFSTTYPTIGFAQTLTALGPNGINCATTNPTATSACLLDSVVGCAANANGPCTKSGFNFYLTGTAPAAGQPAADYEADAGPVGWFATGTKNFCSGPDAVVRQYGVPEGATASEAGKLGSAVCEAPPWVAAQ